MIQIYNNKNKSKIENNNECVDEHNNKYESEN
jgi:arsenate reductase-like glutaredoxin family protein